jgi:hypothetical protein
MASTATDVGLKDTRITVESMKEIDNTSDRLLWHWVPGGIIKINTTLPIVSGCQ